MLKTDDPSAVAAIRDFLDEISFAYMSYRLIPYHDTLIFPEFRVLQESIKGLNSIYRLVFSLFRQGHVADDAILRKALPKDLFDAFVSTGLLVQNERKQWRTPSLVIVPIEGLNLVVSTPPHYPTAITRKQPIYIGIESLWLTRAIPARLGGRRVLDICSGSGIQGLICAARGASHVVGLEMADEAVSISRFNVALNGFGDTVEIRQSDLFSALSEDEEFDFVISNPPFMPVMDDVDYPICGTGGADGTRLLRLIYADLPKYLADGAEGVMFCNALGDQFSINFNREVLTPLAKEHNLCIRSYVNDKFTLDEYIVATLDGNLINTCPELTVEQRQQKIAAWQEELRQKGVEAGYIYGQILRFWKGRPEVGMTNLPSYNPYMTDPLVSKAMQAKASA
ncbi:MAG TPA: methyltransferase [Pyrinomonadaceae bacterium]|nr:methyltransferase [Pyrinomonadaceae bacterium]